ncbi:hypothetical protein K523DRAFT_323714 [Schizophyllum commune Tattone D]|nr:hypothetical protein K523DRAFT_323714 [Schizophyllum commune Tattone D]
MEAEMERMRRHDGNNEPQMTTENSEDETGCGMLRCGTNEDGQRQHGTEHNSDDDDASGTADLTMR